MQCAATEPGGCWGAPSLRTVTPRGRASLLHAHLRAPRETFPLPPAEDEPIAPLLSEHQCHLEFPLWAATWKVSLRSPPCTAMAPLSTVQDAVLEEGAASRAAPQGCHHTYGICPFSALCIPGMVCDDAPPEWWVWVHPRPHTAPPRMELVMLHPATLLFFRPHRFQPQSHLSTLSKPVADQIPHLHHLKKSQSCSFSISKY